MINEYLVKKYCCEDISLIENYEKAIADKQKTWHCHHRKETDEGYSGKELIDLGLYWNRPASELIFMTESEHRRLHKKGKHHSEEHKRKLSESLSKPVNQIDKNTGAIIKTWPSARKVFRELGIGNINKCCKGKLKSAGGFIWCYAD